MSHDGSRDTGVRAVRPGGLVLAFDLGTQLGEALLDSDGRRAWSLSHPVFGRQRKGDHPGVRWITASVHFPAAIGRAGPNLQLIAYEDVLRHQVGAFANFRAAQVYGALLAMLLAAACDAGVPVVGISPSQVKLRATQSGGAKKDDMIQAAAWRWECIPADDNEADALWTAWAGLQGDGHAPGAGHARGGRRRAAPAS